MIISFPFATIISILIITSSLIAISRSNWLFIWLALEINIACFIPIILITKSNQELEATIKYFLIQALGSSLLLLYSYILWYTYQLSILTTIILILRLLIKLGAAPFHFWYPAVISSSNWLTCLLLSTWQKLAPLFIVLVLFLGSYWLSLLASLNALLGGLIGINQSKLRSLMAYSSLVHLGWIFGLIYSHKCLYTLFYFILYSLIVTPMFLIFHLFNIQYISFSHKSFSLNPVVQISLPIILLSLRGIPPFTGFIPKWLAIYVLWETPQLLLILILGSLISTFYYLNLIFSSTMSTNLNYSIIQPILQNSLWLLIPLTVAGLFFIPLILL
jgi:NADH-ubiquinone oxidoreductase chain 2